jgi:hypothetical protein
MYYKADSLTETYKKNSILFVLEKYFCVCVCVCVYIVAEHD